MDLKRLCFLKTLIALFLTSTSNQLLFAQKVNFSNENSWNDDSFLLELYSDTGIIYYTLNGEIPIPNTPNTFEYTHL